MPRTVFRSKQAIAAYRIGTAAHPLFDGSGAAASDAARWNTRGRFVIYASEHYAAALLEKAAQLNTLKVPRNLVFIRIEVPAGASVEELTASELPDWDDDSKNSSQRFGNTWYDEQRSLVLLVPSMVAPGLERNVVINQRHPEFRKLRASASEPVICHPKLRAG